MHENTLTARFILCKLADGLEKWQAFDVTNGAADFTQHEIHFIFTDRDEIFDLIRNMRDHLNGFSQIIATTFLFQYIGIDPTR